jgi:hypothetical protein
VTRPSILTLMGLVLVSPANAQRKTEADTGSSIPIPLRARLPDRPGLSAADRGRIAMAEFARCTVDRREAGVVRMLNLPAEKVLPGSFAGLADDECLASGQMKFRPMLLRGALFVELYRRRNAAMMRQVAWRMPVVRFDANAPVDPASETPAVEMGLLAFAECVAKRDPVNAKAIVVGPTVSKAQDAAFAAITPNLGPCLFADQKITLGKIYLEGALGEVLYRGSAASADTAPQGGK